MARRAAAVTVAVCLVLGCGADGDALGRIDVASRGVAADASTTTGAPTSPPSLAPPTSRPSPPATASAVVTTTAPPPQFAAQVREIDPTLAGRMRTSWRPGCPVPLVSLRHLTLRHWDGVGGARDGELVVHADHADAVVSVFAELFAAGFPIARMQLVDDYGGDDQASMRANNTSAFNCREVAGRPGVLSNHALGTAIDINPLVNPWVNGRTVDPPEGAPYADRSQRVPGGIYPGDVVTRAFARIGWGWGGDWPSSKDWQHFSASGR
jgi:hypothetical protein